MKNYIFLFIIIFASFFVGCNKNNITTPEDSGTGHGQMLLKFNKTEAPSNVSTITAYLTRSGYSTISGSLNLLSDTSAAISLQNIASGLWHLKIEAADNNYSIIYRGETDVEITAGTITQVNLTLQPVSSGTGGIYILVSWGSQQPVKWTVQNSGVSVNLQTVFFINQTTGWAGGENGVILKTTDGGINWIKQSTPTVDRINSICFQDTSTGWAVGENGTFLKTVTGGSSWFSYTNSIPNSLYSIRFYDATGWITGSNGAIIQFQPAQNLYILRYSPYSFLLLSSMFKTSSTGWIVGVSGTILKTTDGGMNWYNSGSNSMWQWLQSVYFFDLNTGVAVGGSGSIIRTTNGGSSWNQVYSGTYENLEELCFINSTTGWTVGDHGTILKTTDSGLNWSNERTGVNTWLNAVCFYGQDAGFAVGNNGTILKYKP